ncbi:hypothetical protein ACWG8W_06365 [Citricoccus zhacaiensis]
MKTPNFRKPLAVAALVAAFALTGCADKPVPDAPTPSPTAATQSATPSPTAAPTLTAAPTQGAFEIDPEANPTAIETVKDDEINRLMREGLNTAKSVDLDEAWSKYSTDQAKKSFTEEQAKDGAAFAMEFLHDVTTSADFYVARDGSKDFEILSNEDVTSRMDSVLLDAIRASIAENGRFVHIPSSFEDGMAATSPEGENLALTAATPLFNYYTPGLDAKAVSGGVTRLVVNGTREETLHLEGGYTAKGQVKYTVQVTPEGDDWKVMDLSWAPEGELDWTKAGEAK